MTVFADLLTLLPFLISAMCRVLPDYPQINARFDDEAGIVHRSGAVHMGMATQTDNGLAVPVIRDAQNHDVWGLAREILRLAEATRAGKASREELSGSTITISSLGPMGGIVSTPVINRPEVAIIAVNKVKEMPVVIAGTGYGKIKKGYHVREQGGNMAKAHVTLLRGLGLDIDAYGFHGSETSDDFGADLFT